MNRNEAPKRMIDMTDEDFRTIIREEIEGLISYAIPKDEFEHIKRFSTENAARYLKLSVATIEQYRCVGKISYYKTEGGRFSHFTRDQLDEYRDLYVKNSIRSVVYNGSTYRA